MPGFLLLFYHEKAGIPCKIGPFLFFGLESYAICGKLPFWQSSNRNDKKKAFEWDGFPGGWNSL